METLKHKKTRRTLLTQKPELLLNHKCEAMRETSILFFHPPLAAAAAAAVVVTSNCSTAPAAAHTRDSPPSSLQMLLLKYRKRRNSRKGHAERQERGVNGREDTALLYMSRKRQIIMLSCWWSGIFFHTRSS